MTTPWTITPDWQGATVAVLGSGPSMSAAVAESLQHHRTIVVNYAMRVAPWADMLVALDGNWPQEFRDFAGLRVTGVADEEIPALYAGPWREKVAINPAQQADLRQAGVDALRLLAGVNDALYAGAWWERVTISPSHEVEIRNSGLAAIRIAAAMGASRIILAGFDPEARGHFYDDEVDTGAGPDPYFGVAAGLTAITAEFAARGIVVERYAPAVQTPAGEARHV